LAARQRSRLLLPALLLRRRRLFRRRGRRLLGRRLLGGVGLFVVVIITRGFRRGGSRRLLPLDPLDGRLPVGVHRILLPVRRVQVLTRLGLRIGGLPELHRLVGDLDALRGGAAIPFFDPGGSGRQALGRQQAGGGGFKPVRLFLLLLPL